MTVIKINAMTVPEEGGDELARRFGRRAGAVDQAEGFEGFELLRPRDPGRPWLVVTRWRDDASFEAWVASPAFAHGHRGESARSGDPGPGHHEPSAHAHGHGSAPGGESGSEPAPVATASELWDYEVVTLPAVGDR